MGLALGVVRKNVTEGKETAKVELVEQLQILERMINGRLSIAKTSILAGERNDLEIHYGTVVEEMQYITIIKARKPELDNEIKDFFR